MRKWRKDELKEKEEQLIEEEKWKQLVEVVEKLRRSGSENGRMKQEMEEESTKK